MPVRHFNLETRAWGFELRDRGLNGFKRRWGHGIIERPLWLSASVAVPCCVYAALPFAAAVLPAGGYIQITTTGFLFTLFAPDFRRY